MIRAIVFCWSYWTCPFRNDRHKYLSLARLVFAASVTVFLFCAYRNSLSIPSIVGFCLLWILCWGDIATSKLSGDVLRIVATRWSIVSPASGEVSTATVTEGECQPGQALPETEETEAP